MSKDNEEGKGWRHDIRKETEKQEKTEKQSTHETEGVKGENEVRKSERGKRDLRRGNC